MTNLLFEPMKIGNVELKNRISLAPMGLSGLVTSEGGFNSRGVEYFVERAKNGVGLLITGCAKVEHVVEPFAMPSQPNPTFNPTHFIQSSIEMTERIHAYGSKIFLQMTFGFGRVVHPKTALKTPVAPSPVPNFWDPSILCRELETEEIEFLIEKFAEAALIARESGFDGIEVHAVHEGYLLDQFAMPLFNKRDDKFGGSLENRLRAPIEVLRRTKAIAGEDFPVMLRYGVRSYMKDLHKGILPDEEAVDIGRDTEQGLQIAKLLEDAGYDAFNADGGVYDSWYWSHPPMYLPEGCYLPLTRELKNVIEKPVLVAGKMGNPELAEKAIVEGWTDGVSLGRPLLADPEWVLKVRSHRTNSIRPCIGCHEGCLKRIARCKPLSCAVNPRAGREVTYSITEALQTKKVSIIGGGIAGMEAARISALRGHSVTLFEATDSLGGHVLEGSRPDFKQDDRRLLDWYERELRELPVDIRLGETVSSQGVFSSRPDVVLIATGSKPVVPPIPGLDIGQEYILTARNALLQEKAIGHKAVIIGGGLVGCELALWLSQKGHHVTILERLPQLMELGDIPLPNKMMLLELLEQYNVKKHTGAEVAEIGASSVYLKEGVTLPADSVILATGYCAEKTLFEAIQNKIPETYVIGDALNPSNIKHAIWSAYEVARTI